MKKNLPFFLVGAALIFLIVGVIVVLYSGEKKSPQATLQQRALPEQTKVEQRVTIAEQRGAKNVVEEAEEVARKPREKAKEKVLFGFEEKTPLWEVPDWCLEKDNYVGQFLASSSSFAREGESSLEVMTDFPGRKWTAAYVETQQYFDWTPYERISADVFLPQDAPFGLQAKFILTVGEDWTWTEMARLKKLVPGQWTTITASIIPGSNDWRRTLVTDEFRTDVRKLGVRVESNMKPIYKGPVYIDNLRLE